MQEQKTKENTFSFKVNGMTCASCVQRVEKSLKEVPDAHYISVNLATEKAYVIGNEKLTQKQLANAVKKAGYSLSEDTTDDTIAHQFSESRKNMLISIAITIPLMVLMFLHMSGTHIPGFLYIELIAGAFSLLYIGRGVLKSAWIAISHFHTNMDTLVSIGAVAAYTTTLLALLQLNVISFGSISVMLIALHITGRYIEAKLKYRAAKEVHSLLSLQVKTATVINQNNEHATLPIDDIPVDATLLIRAGERVPLDGIITKGTGSIDESMISGEAVPVRKTTGSPVTGGTLLNSGLVEMKVEKTGSDTFLSRMVKLVEEAQSAKVPIQALADKITAIFIPVILLIAVVSAITWFFNYDSMKDMLVYLSTYIPWINPNAGALSTAIFVFVAVLVIACPCALGLATPMALITGSGTAAKNGLLIKNGEVIQKAKDIDVLLLDKTGTITAGRPHVTETNIEDRELAVIASLEKHSTHPLAAAIINHAQEKGITEQHTMHDITEKAGSGISGRLNGGTFFCGRPKESSRYNSLLNQGNTIVEAYKNDILLGYFAISDPVKQDAVTAIQMIKDAGIKPVMVTGDNQATANIIARQVGIDEVIAGVQPADKVREVRKHQLHNKIVAMIGDGINDAAALKSADIGIAIGTGTDLAVESGDIIIINGELSKVLDAILISKNIFSKIRQNLFWAFFYNIIAIPMAVLGILHPAIAEAAMTLSSITVIANSMRIKISHKKADAETEER